MLCYVRPSQKNPLPSTRTVGKEAKAPARPRSLRCPIVSGRRRNRCCCQALSWRSLQEGRVGLVARLNGLADRNHESQCRSLEEKEGGTRGWESTGKAREERPRPPRLHPPAPALPPRHRLRAPALQLRRRLRAPASPPPRRPREPAWPPPPGSCWQRRSR